jgi:hypothetical protein
LEAPDQHQDVDVSLVVDDEPEPVAIHVQDPQREAVWRSASAPVVVVLGELSYLVSLFYLLVCILGMCNQSRTQALVSIAVLSTGCTTDTCLAASSPSS